MLPFVIAGLVSGAVYGLAGVGLVLTYKTSRVFNFAHGGLAAVSAYVFYTLHVQAHWAWPAAAAVAILVTGPILGVAFERLGRAVAARGIAAGVAGTVGVLLAVEAAIVLIYGSLLTRIVPVFLGTGEVSIGGTEVEIAQIVTFAFALVATVVLYAMFRLTRAGSEVRAVVDDPELLELEGTSATSVRRFSWVLGVCLAAASGVLLSSLLPLDPVQLTLLVVQAYAAAALGAFSNLPVTFLAGLGIGVVASISTKYTTSLWLTGVPSALPFLVLFAVLLVFPKRFLAQRSAVTPVGRSTRRMRAPLQTGTAVVVLAALIAVPSFAGIHLTDWTTGVAMIMLFLSLGLLVRTSGQVSLCHITFMAIGAVAFAHLTHDGVPWAPALIISSIICIPVGALLAVPAIRLGPLYLALATFGFGVFVEYLFYSQSFMFGSTGAGLNEPLPGWGLGTGTGYYYLVLALTIVAAVVIVVLDRSRLGRLLRGMAQSPSAVTTAGVATNVTWVLVFCLSAALAAAAGALIAVAQSTVVAASYAPLTSLTYLALVIIVIGGAPWYAVIAGLFLTLIPSYFPGTNTSYWLQLVFGISAVAYAITPESALSLPRSLQARLFGAAQATSASSPPATANATATGAPTGPAPGGELELGDVTVRYGGNVAVRDVTVTGRVGDVTGLIGPNGAGKTTLFNVASGLVRPSGGQVRFEARDISRAGPSRRAREGLGRTFQRMELFDGQSVYDNVRIGAEGALAGANPLRHFIARPGDGRRVDAAVRDALTLCGLAAVADRPVGALSTGQRRLVELARCLAGPFRLLLLDEPSSGLDRAETAQFARIVRRAVAERGVGVLLVEHDMSLVSDVCSTLFVLDSGALIAQGEVHTVLGEPSVQRAYLGTAAALPAPAVEVGEAP